MDYEKAYKEALERARGHHGVAINYGKTEEIQELEHVFPELRESEDEKMRNRVIESLICYRAKVYDEGDKEVSSMVDEEIIWMRKQKEQKSLSPDEKMNHPLYLEGFDVGREVGKVEAEQKPEWSEEDEEMRNLIVAIFEVNHPDGFFKANELGTTDMRGVHTEEIISWLKSLPERFNFQPKQEWSEEDEKRIKQLIYDTEAIKAGYEKRKEQLGERFNEALIKDCDEQIQWLKSLRPQPHWKPSEEQMEALMLAIEGKWEAIKPTGYMSRRLEDLYEGLANTFKVDCKLEK